MYGLVLLTLPSHIHPHLSNEFCVTDADTEHNYALMDSSTYKWYQCKELPEKCIHDETHASRGCAWLSVSCNSK